MSTVLPQNIWNDYQPFEVDNLGWWLILGDIHLKFHDIRTLELAVREAKKRNVKGIIINGDLFDFYAISVFDKDPTGPRVVEEIEAGKQFFAWLREQFPKARIVFKEGNHDERLEKYIFRKAPELYGLPGLNLASLLELKQRGIEHVGDKRVIWAGKLNIIHGHEYMGPRLAVLVNPGRSAILAAIDNIAVCHWHTTSEQPQMSIRGKLQAGWSIGCACDLHPKERPLQKKWNNGFALVDLMNRGDFKFDNKKVHNGEVF